MKNKSLILNSNELKKLSEIIHKVNVDCGWWNEARSVAILTNLMHSELSEAMEGLRKGLKDDHLPHYDMVLVELADCVIRCLDYLGYVEYDFTSTIYSDDITLSDLCGLPPYELDIHEAIATAHANLSFAYQNVDNRSEFIDMTARVCILAMEMYYPAFKPKAIILEKVTYNKQRADHKLANRNKQGGKAF